MPFEAKVYDSEKGSFGIKFMEFSAGQDSTILLIDRKYVTVRSQNHENKKQFGSTSGPRSIFKNETILLEYERACRV